jgi:hypothetical protein
MQDPTKPLPVIEAGKQSNNSLLRPPTDGSWKPGQTGNPNGRPKREWTFQGELEKALEDEAKDGKSYKYHLMRALLSQGLKGNVQAIEKIMNRVDGMPKQQLEMEAKGDWNITLKRDEK